MKHKPLITLAEMARLMGVHLNTLRRLQRTHSDFPEVRRVFAFSQTSFRKHLRHTHHPTYVVRVEALRFIKRYSELVQDVTR